jgi:hypothetical protein
MFTVNREITAKRYNNRDACAYRLETPMEVFSYKMSTQHKLLSFPPIQRLEHKEAAKRPKPRVKVLTRRVGVYA